MNNDAQNQPTNLTDSKSLDALKDALGDAVSSIPAPIRRNALKALRRLLAASVEWPAAVLEGYADERRATTQARIALIEATAGQISSQLNVDPTFAKRASVKFAESIVRGQSNVDEISRIALNDLTSIKYDQSKAQLKSEQQEISDDWINSFETEAANMSSSEMQMLFGRILAGEIRRPKSFSIRTVKLVSGLDNLAATKFKLLCSLCCHFIPPQFCRYLDVRVVSSSNAAQNGLMKFGLSFDDLNILNEYGLIVADYNSYMQYNLSLYKNGNVGLPFGYQGKYWVLHPKDENAQFGDLKMNGVALSASGKELYRIVEIDKATEYTIELERIFAERGVTMVPIAWNPAPK